MATARDTTPVVRITKEALAALKRQAANERRSLQEVASWAIMEYIRADEKRGQL